MCSTAKPLVTFHRKRTVIRFLTKEIHDVQSKNATVRELDYYLSIAGDHSMPALRAMAEEKAQEAVDLLKAGLDRGRAR